MGAARNVQRPSKPDGELPAVPRRTAKTIALGYAKFGLVLMILSTLFSLFGRYHWTLELLTHFKAVYFCIGLLCTATVGAASARPRALQWPSRDREFAPIE